MWVPVSLRVGKSILIVDSDQGFAQSAQDALEILGIAVHTVDDASIDTVRKMRPAVVLLNVELGRKPMAGFSLCSRIRRDKDLKDLPIFLTSSEATPQSLEKHAQSTDRANEYAIKPVAIEALIGKLTEMLEAAPEPSPSDNGGWDPEDEDEDGLDPQVRTPPPPIPRGASANPPPLPQGPPPLPKTGDVGSPATDTDLWPAQRFEDAFRQATASEPEQALGRASPEERLNALRSLVKKYQTREKALKSTWDEVMQRGADLARQVVALQLNQQQAEARLEEVIRTRDTTQTRLGAVESEFRAFQEEITRIFQEKDAEEAAKLARTAEIEDANTTLREQLHQAHEALSDDQKRLSLLQEEIEELDQLRAAGEAAAEEIAELRARLETVEAVSTDRGQQVHNLHDQLDQLVFEKTNAEQQLEREYDAKLEVVLEEHRAELDRVHGEHKEREFSLEATHLAQVEGLETERAEQLAALEVRHRELLETLNNTHDAEAAEFEEKRRAASDQIRALNDWVAQLESMLEVAGGKDDRIVELEAAITELEETLEAERGEAGRRIGELEGELDGAQTNFFERLAELDHYRKSATNLESRSHDLESSLKLAEKSLKQTRAEAAQYKGGYEEAHAEREALQEQVENLEDQLSRLEEKDRETTRMLEEERARWQRAEDLVRKAKEKLETSNQERERFESQIASLESELEEVEQSHADLSARTEQSAKNEQELESRLEEEMASRQELEAMLESERGVRAEVESQLEDVQSELSRREAELSDAYSETTTLRRKVETSGSELQARVTSLTSQLEKAQKETAAKDAELQGLKHSIEDAGAQIGSFKAEVDSLAADLEDTQQKLRAAQDDALALQVSEDALINEIEVKADRLRQLESAVAELKKELERTKSDNRAMIERQRLVRKVAGVLDKARRSIPEHFSEVMADAAVQDALKPQLYTGEVEPLGLSDTVDPDYSPPTAVIRQAALAARLGEPTSEPSNENAAPFAALMAEIQATEDDVALGFDEKFAAETTTESPQVMNQNPKFGGALSNPVGHRYESEDGEEEEEGSVTEIIRLDKLD